MTVLEVIQKSSEFLTGKGVESPRLQTELMLAHVLRLKRLELYLNYTRALTDPELGTLRDMVRRRALREPLQHILGSVSFDGLELAVNRSVLIPRPETELLAELAVAAVKEQFAGQPATVLDYGTGSGCLAIALAVRCPGTTVHAVDVSPAALEVARANAARHNAAITFHEAGRVDDLPAGLRWDLVVSNPPYIPAGDIAGLEPEVREFDPRLALDGGLDGLDCFRQLAASLPGRMSPGARFLAEFGDGQAAALTGLFAQHGWQDITIRSDDSPRERFLLARAPASG